MNLALDNIKYDSKGLVPAIVQDFNTREVLMLAYMNEESLKMTIDSNTTWFYSRSRKELWNKGATSGNIQVVKNILYDCDGDTLLVEVEPAGPACHTGEKTCFYRNIDSEIKQNDSFEKAGKAIPEKLYDLIVDRKINPKEGSYTNYLFEKGIDKILKKVGEEASEVIIASKNSDNQELIYEVSDLAYHLIVLLVEKGVKLDEIAKELAKRHK